MATNRDASAPWASRAATFPIRSSTAECWRTRVGLLVAFSTKEADQEMNPAALRNEDNALAPVLYMGLELSNKNWRLA